MKDQTVIGASSGGQVKSLLYVRFQRKGRENVIELLSLLKANQSGVFSQPYI